MIASPGQIARTTALLLTLIAAAAAINVTNAQNNPGKTETGPSFQMAQVENGSARHIFQGVGVVTANKPAGSLTINHQAIEGLMPAMEMMFSVTPKRLTTSVRPGDTVEFSVDGKTYTITALKVHGHGK